MPNNEIEFSTGLLREKIRDKGMTLEDFATAMGLNIVTLHRKMRGATYWTQKEIFKATDILGVSDSKEAWELFFRPKNIEN